MHKQFRSVVVMVVVLLSIPVDVMARCLVTVDLYNDRRRVPGEVNVECTGIHYGFNSDPTKNGYGNWGVASFYGAVRDTDQFAGWYSEDNKLQWQSCTRKLPKPNCDVYNDNNCRGQKAVPDNKRRYGGYIYFLPHGVLCNTIGVETVEAIDMHLYELDWPDADDPVASLVYGDINVRLSCSSAWKCSGESTWRAATSSGGTVSARVRAEVNTTFWESR